MSGSQGRAEKALMVEHRNASRSFSIVHPIADDKRSLCVANMFRPRSIHRSWASGNTP
jgi:hypothetical protein